MGYVKMITFGKDYLGVGFLQRNWMTMLGNVLIVVAIIKQNIVRLIKMYGRKSKGNQTKIYCKTQLKM